MDTTIQQDLTWAQVMALPPRTSSMKPQNPTELLQMREKSPLLRLPRGVQLKIYKNLYKRYTVKVKAESTVYGPHIPSTIDCGDPRNRLHTRRLRFSGLPSDSDDAILRVSKAVRAMAMVARKHAFTGRLIFWSEESTSDLLKFFQKYGEHPKFAALFSRVTKLDLPLCGKFLPSAKAVLQIFPSLKSIRVMARGTNPHKLNCSAEQCIEALPVYVTDFTPFIDCYRDGLYDRTMTQLFDSNIAEMKACNETLRRETKHRVTINLKCLCIVAIHNGKKCDGKTSNGKTCGGKLYDRYLLVMVYRVVDDLVKIVRRSVLSLS